MGLNRAIDGDIVAIELLPEDQWSTPSEIVLQDEDETDIIGDILDDEKELNNSNNVKETERTPTGKIVGIIRRKWRQYCGILQPNIIQGVNIFLFMIGYNDISMNWLQYDNNALCSSYVAYFRT